MVVSHPKFGPQCPTDFFKAMFKLLLSILVDTTFKPINELLDEDGLTRIASPTGADANVARLESLTRRWRDAKLQELGHIGITVP